MTDEDIQKAWRDIGGVDGRMILPLYEFARAIEKLVIAQARAELIAEIRAEAAKIHVPPDFKRYPAEYFKAGARAVLTIAVPKA